MKDKFTCGFGVASLMLSLSTTSELLRKGVITKPEAVEIVLRAKALLAMPSPSVDPDVLKFAERALELASIIVSSVSDEKHASGSN